MSITVEQAKALKPGDITHTADGRRWKVNGMVKVWKRSPGRVQVPVKFGLYGHGYIDENNCHMFTLGEPDSKR